MTNNEKTLEALSQSKQKWYGITFNSKTDIGTNNCALCILFRAENCQDCPVAKDTNKNICDNTPYVLWVEYLDDLLTFEEHYHVIDEISRSIAFQEYLYLDSLQRKYRTMK